VPKVACHKPTSNILLQRNMLNPISRNTVSTVFYTPPLIAIENPYPNKAKGRKVKIRLAIDAVIFLALNNPKMLLINAVIQKHSPNIPHKKENKADASTEIPSAVKTPISRYIHKNRNQPMILSNIGFPFNLDKFTGVFEVREAVFYSFNAYRHYCRLHTLDCCINLYHHSMGTGLNPLGRSSYHNYVDIKPEYLQVYKAQNPYVGYK